MLVLSRSSSEAIEFPSLGISIKVLQLSRSRVRLGIDAPREIQVRRQELPSSDFSGLPQNHGQITESPISSHLQAAIESLEKVQRAAEITDSGQVLALLTRIIRDLDVLDKQVQQWGPGTQQETAQKSCRALVVDDCENEAKLLASFLRLKNFEVDSVANGAEAISYLSRHAMPDVILLDMNMPQFNGGWTVREIRRDSKLENLKVFAVSGIHPMEYGVEIGPGGCDRWFQKPINPSTLVDEIIHGSKSKESVLN
ncbi:response regulator [Bremerella sp. JC770]|uniref:response regulator n=1 Tax=Bremerella sp. JC770 TaxID=3232137 RepID=UPI00345AEC50